MIHYLQMPLLNSHLQNFFLLCYFWYFLFQLYHTFSGSSKWYKYCIILFAAFLCTHKIPFTFWEYITKITRNNFNVFCSAKYTDKKLNQGSRRVQYFFCFVLFLLQFLLVNTFLHAEIHPLGNTQKLKTMLQTIITDWQDCTSSGGS